MQHFKDKNFVFFLAHSPRAQKNKKNLQRKVDNKIFMQFLSESKMFRLDVHYWYLTHAMYYLNLALTTFKLLMFVDIYTWERFYNEFRLEMKMTKQKKIQILTHPNVFLVGVLIIIV